MDAQSGATHPRISNLAPRLNLSQLLHFCRLLDSLMLVQSHPLSSHAENLPSTRQPLRRKQSMRAS
jgi:hypothetical protein